MTTIYSKELEQDFDDDLAKSLLSVSLDKGVNPREVVSKSLYNIDLESVQGVSRLLELLPILDPEIVKEVYQEIFPGYPTDDLSDRVAKTELKGYLLDYLHDQEPNEGQ